MAILVNTAPPVLTGTPNVGQTLTCTMGTWTGADALESVWLRNGSPIAGTRMEGDAASTYVVRPGDTGQGVSCQVSGRNQNGTTVATSSVVTVTRTSSVVVGSGAGTFASRPAAGAVPAGYIYFATDDNGGTPYRSDGTAWLKMSAGVLETGGRELGYGEITSNFTTTTVSAAVDVTGLSITVTVASRPILVEFFTSQFFHSAAGATPSFRLLEDGAIVQVGNTVLPTAAAGLPINIKVRRAPAAGSHTYKMQVFQPAAPGGTITVQGGAAAPASIRATEG